MSLSKKFKPKFSYDLIRIGNDNDGGYLIDTYSFKKTKELVSLGINDDWSFEKDFFLRRNKKISVECFDDRLDKKFLIKKLVINFVFILYHLKFEFFLDAVKKFFSYIKFKKIFLFEKKRISYKDLDIILKKKNKNIFLKIDIETSEYRILKDIISNQKKIIGLVIEFHDCDLHKKKIINFINSLDLTLVHIHGNNLSSKDFSGNPTAIELSFARFPLKKNKTMSLPNKLDMPNNKNQTEARLSFKD